MGKTDLSITLAEAFGGEIVSADSRLFYRGMDIGTAKPSREERARVPHHLIDVADPDDTWSLARFQRAATTAIGQIHARRQLPFLVGGTGQYVRSITAGWQIPATQPDQRLRAALEAWGAEVGPQGLHDRLAVIDPQAAQKIEPRNLRRTVRALEVIFSQGRRFSEVQQRGDPDYRILTVGLNRPREVLYARIDARIEQMMAQGFLEEVESLLAQGYSPDLPSFSAIGYRELSASLRGEISIEVALQQIKKGTRQYVRRQANWFKAQDPAICWFQADQEPLGDIKELILEFLT